MNTKPAHKQELEALDQVLTALTPLSAPSQMRIMLWAKQWLEAPTPATPATPAQLNGNGNGKHAPPAKRGRGRPRTRNVHA
jgi:hypothetical protein